MNRVNGVDNGILSFKNVRVPRDNLLDSVASVSPSGEFSSPIERKRDRFLTLADQLLSGRLCIASMCLGASKYGLRTAVKYALSRKALGRDGKSSAKLMSFQLQQRAFMPLIAETYAHNIALNYAKDQFKLLQDAEGEEHQKLVVLCCVLKPMITWSTNEIANTVRERCGGQGYLSINRFGELWAGAHAGMTAEGDNSVLMQKVAKELLMMEKNKAEVAKYMIETSLPLSMQRMMARTSFGDLSDPQFQLRLFNLREKRAKMMLMSRLQLDRIQSHLPLYDSWCHQNQVSFFFIFILIFILIFLSFFFFFFFSFFAHLFFSPGSCPTLCESSRRKSHSRAVYRSDPKRKRKRLFSLPYAQPPLPPLRFLPPFLLPLSSFPPNPFCFLRSLPFGTRRCLVLA